MTWPILAEELLEDFKERLRDKTDFPKLFPSISLLLGKKSWEQLEAFNKKWIALNLREKKKEVWLFGCNDNE